MPNVSEGGGCDCSIVQFLIEVWTGDIDGTRPPERAAWRLARVPSGGTPRKGLQTDDVESGRD